MKDKIFALHNNTWSLVSLPPHTREKQAIKENNHQVVVLLLDHPMLPRKILVQLQYQHELNLDNSDFEFKEFEELINFLKTCFEGEEE